MHLLYNISQWTPCISILSNNGQLCLLNRIFTKLRLSVIPFNFKTHSSQNLKIEFNQRRICWEKGAMLLTFRSKDISLYVHRMLVSLKTGTELIYLVFLILRVLESKSWIGECVWLGPHFLVFGHWVQPSFSGIFPSSWLIERV
jgi:hypothetical protein